VSIVQTVEILDGQFISTSSARVLVNLWIGRSSDFVRMASASRNSLAPPDHCWPLGGALRDSGSRIPRYQYYSRLFYSFITIVRYTIFTGLVFLTEHSNTTHHATLSAIFGS